MSRKVDPVQRVLDAYRALSEPERMAADYLLRREGKGEHIAVGPVKRGRPAGSKNQAKGIPLLEPNAAKEAGL